MIIIALHALFCLCNPKCGDILPAHNETHRALF